MGIFDIFGKKPEQTPSGKNSPFVLKVRMNPIRLEARRGETVDLRVELKNVKQDAVMTSISIDLPEKLGFDEKGLNTTREMRLGNLKPGEDRELVVPVYSTAKTTPGNEVIKVTAFAHYRDYSHTENAVKASTSLRVV